MDRLQAHFYPEIRALVQLGEILDDIIRQAVGTRCNGQADYTGLLQNNLIIFSQLVNRSVRIGVGLEVADVFGVRPFEMLAVAHMIELCDQIVPAAAGEIAGASGAAEGTASFGDRAVTVRTGKTGIEHYFEDFRVHVLAHFVVPRMETFISPQQRRGGL
ncbi:hypothetical protein D3C75_807900 [compost metagenome]